MGYVVIAIPVDNTPTREELNQAIKLNIEEPDKVPIACESKTDLVKVYKLSGDLMYDDGELTDEGYETIQKLIKEQKSEI